jgi:hypothetical protein
MKNFVDDQIEMRLFSIKNALATTDDDDDILLKRKVKTEAEKVGVKYDS